MPKLGVAGGLGWVVTGGLGLVVGGLVGVLVVGGLVAGRLVVAAVLVDELVATDVAVVIGAGGSATAAGPVVVLWVTTRLGTVDVAGSAAGDSGVVAAGGVVEPVVAGADVVSGVLVVAVVVAVLVSAVVVRSDRTASAWERVFAAIRNGVLAGSWTIVVGFDEEVLVE